MMNFQRPVRQSYAGIFAAIGLLAAATAVQAQTPGRMRGTIEAVDGGLVTAKLRDGSEVKLRLADKPRLMAMVPTTLKDVAPGDFIGIVSVPEPDGTNKAIEIHVFPEAARGTGEGQQPWDTMPRSTMTNATLDTKVAAVDGQKLTVKFKGGEAKVTVVPETVIVRGVAGSPSDVKPGNKFVAFGLTKAEDGVFDVKAMNVGRDGLTPPM